MGVCSIILIEMKRLWHNLLRFLRSNLYSIVFFVLILVSIMALFWVSWSEVGALGSTNAVVRLVRLAADAAVLMLPYWFLPRRWRWCVLAGVGAIVVWTMAALCYFRFWGKPLELYSVLLVQNLDSTLLSSGLSLCKGTDLVYPAILLVDIAAYVAMRRRIVQSPKFTLWSKVALSGATLLLFAASQYLATRSIARWGEYADIPNVERTINRHRFTELFDAHRNILMSGCVVYLVKSAVIGRHFINLEKELTRAERERIAKFQSGAGAEVPDTVASAFGANCSKNLVLIVVESLNADVVNARAGGRLVAPTLTALASAQGSIAAANVECQIREGCSGDGQLLINTGLHPLSSMPLSVYTSLGDNTTFPSLIRMLKGRPSAAIFADDAKVWNQRNATMSLGMDTVYDKRQYGNRFSRFGGDGNMFQFAIQKIKQFRQPFFAELYTVSMHAPFSTADIPSHLVPNWVDDDTSIAPMRRKYLKTVGYFDGQLQQFISALKKAGLYDNTVLVVVSDHSIPMADDDKALGSMLFIAANTGITASIARKVGQVDLYPTVLQIMGIYPTAAWKGVGTPILDSRLNATYNIDTQQFLGTPHPALQQRMKDAFPISELILRGNYFQ